MDIEETYYNQRRDRLADAVGDYLTCDDTSARQCYEEMLAEVDGWINHHRQHLNKAQALKDLLICLLYTSPSPRDYAASRMPSSA